MARHRGGRLCKGFAFDFSKAFESVYHFILPNKFREMSINPYTATWIINFLFSR